MFQDPVDFDFLQNCGNNGLAGRDFGKESLFVKFDPLVSRLPTGARINRDSGAHLKPSENQFNPRKVDGELILSFKCIYYFFTGFRGIFVKPAMVFCKIFKKQF